MTNVILGTNVTKAITLIDGKNAFGEYIKCPKLIIETKDIEPYEILRFSGNIVYNTSGYVSFNFEKTINISEDQEVIVKKTIFRADLNENWIYTNFKNIVEIIGFKNEDAAQEAFDSELEKYADYMMKSYSLFRSYVKANGFKLTAANISKIDSEYIKYKKALESC